MGPAAELLADVGRQDPDVGAAAADREEVDVLTAASRHLEGVDVDRPGVGLELLARPGGFVQLPATDLDGRVGGRALEQVARLPVHRRPDWSSSASTGAVRITSPSASRVVVATPRRNVPS